MSIRKKNGEQRQYIPSMMTTLEDDRTENLVQRQVLTSENSRKYRYTIPAQTSLTRSVPDVHESPADSFRNLHQNQSSVQTYTQNDRQPSIKTVH